MTFFVGMLLSAIIFFGSYSNANAIVVIVPAVLIPVVKIVVLIVSAMLTPILGLSAFIAKNKNKRVFVGILIGLGALVIFALLSYFFIGLVAHRYQSL